MLHDDDKILFSICCKSIGCKWIFKIKRDTKWVIYRYKATLVPKDHILKRDINNEKFSYVLIEELFFQLLIISGLFQARASLD